MSETVGAPFAVYGTLRDGGRLCSAWENNATVEVGCRVNGFRLMRKQGFWYPVVVGDPKASVVVDLLWPNADDDGLLMRILDSVEGYPRLFGRLKVGVWRSNGKLVDAWMYCPNNEELLVGLEPVGEDWMVFVDENRNSV